MGKLTSGPPPAVAPMRRIAGLNYGVLDTLLGYMLRRAQHALYIDFHAATERFDVAPQRFSALVLISSNPGIRQGLLADAMGIDRSGALKLVDWLEKRGLARREQSAVDARVWLLHLTDEGQALLSDMTEAVEAHDRKMRAIVGPEEGKLRALLERLAAQPGGRTRAKPPSPDRSKK